MKKLIVVLFLVVGIGCGYLITTLSSSVASGIRDNFIYEDNEKKPPFEWTNRYTLLDEEPKRGRWIYYDKIDELFDEWHFDSGTSKKKIITYSISALLFITIITIVLIRYSKKRARKREIADGETITEASVNEEIEYDHTPEVIDTSAYDDLHKIRRILIEWENSLSSSSKKKPQETISEWFRRISGPVDIIHTYEKVRYGDKIISEEEITTFKNSLSNS
ncbi:hypothetical protein D3H55_15540 [Bacillus salacetis]|uniref:DUF4129 domain-containing protein n=1 Tax=Bacillus salacetis TaxID=2315464 RepID=A0A3A1QU16_9BACI|nr:hypothetical protein [Bacillus salacetis]RIW31383.1 hypothetical protein D3H55_15540 [Bacillus salacetis]